MIAVPVPGSLPGPPEGGGYMTEDFRPSGEGKGRGNINSHTPDPKGSVNY
mgnify:CR=1 FL=1